jgi:hypothetical protein
MIAAIYARKSSSRSPRIRLALLCLLALAATGHASDERSPVHYSIT